MEYKSFEKSNLYDKHYNDSKKKSNEYIFYEFLQNNDVEKLLFFNFIWNEVCFLNDKHFIHFDISNASHFVTYFIGLIMVFLYWLAWVFTFFILL